MKERMGKEVKGTDMVEQTNKIYEMRVSKGSRQQNDNSNNGEISPTGFKNS